jgi:hypothetical protein
MTTKGIITAAAAANMGLLTLIETLIWHKITTLASAISTKALSFATWLSNTAFVGGIASMITYIGTLAGVTVAEGAATTAAIALSGALMAIGIGILLAVIGLIVANIDNIARWLDLNRQTKDVMEEQIRSIRSVRDELSNLNTLELEHQRIQDDINEADRTGATNTQEYSDNVARLAEVEEKMNSSREKAITSSQEYINSVSQFSEQLDFAIKSYIDLVDLTKTKSDLELENTKIQDDLASATARYNSVKGSGTPEEIDAFNTLTIIQSQLIKNNADLTRTSTDLTTAINAESDAFEDLTNYEKALYGTSKDIVGIQRELMDTSSKLTLYEKRRDKLLNVLNNLNKVVGASTRDFWEKQIKLLDATEKLYKLEKSRPAVLEEIFTALADQGMLTPEIIDDYMNLELAQSDLSDATRDYFSMFANLSPEQQIELSKSMKLYDDLIGAGVDLEKAWKIAFEGVDAASLGVDLASFKITMPDIDWSILETIDLSGTVYEYADAFAHLHDIVVDFGDDITPILSLLQDSGVLTEEQVEQYTKWLKITPEVADAILDVSDAATELTEEYTDLIPIYGDLWAATGVFVKGVDATTGKMDENGFAIDENGNKILDLKGSWSAFISKIPFLNSLIDTNKDSVIDDAENFAFFSTVLKGTGVDIGTVDTMWSSLNAETLIGVTSTLAAAESTGTLINPLTDVNTQLEIMKGAPKFDEVLAISASTLTSVSGVPTYLSDINDGIVDLKDSVDDLVTSLEKMIKRMALIELKPEGMGIWEWFLPIWNVERAITTGYEERDYKEKLLEEDPELYDILYSQKGITETKGPQHAVIGEAGAEAVVPLEGANRKYGKSILQQILPKYFPDLAMMQAGGVAGALSTDTTIRQGGKQINITVSTDASELNSAIITFKDAITTFTTSNTTYISTLTPLINNFRDSLSDLLNTIQMFGITMISSSDYFYGQTTTASNMILSTATTFEKSIGIASTILYTNIIRLGKVLSTPIKVNVSVHTDGHQKGGIYNKATMGMFGEAGAEALIPLEGSNRKYGESLLREIIPSYYPDLMFQGGGLFTGGGVSSIDNSRNNEENYNIMGPVSINANNVEEIGRDLKYRYRSSK